ncbi:MAG: glycosyltransferase family 9 protein [Planctomycetes bacterium]|nr:glycosyltransferase family 9 protein [Planctomycetota bacterium]
MVERRPPRILIARLTAIGDCVQTLPLLCALRDRFPRAFIAWAAEGASAEILKGHAALDRLIHLQRRWLKCPRLVWDIRRELRRMKFDMTFDPQGLTKSALLCALSGARKRIGFAGGDGRELSPWLNNCLISPKSVHVVDRTLELLNAFRMERPEAQFRLPQSAIAAASIGRIRNGLDWKRGFAIINSGAGWPSKIWPAERFAAAARHLRESHGLPTLVVWAGAVEKILAQTVVDQAAPHAALAPPTSLAELAALCRQARLFVSSDTGPLHLAAAIGTPCVGLFGPKPVSRNGAYGPQNINLQKVEICDRGHQRGRTDNAAMLAITVEDVCGACDTILARDRARRCA